MLGFIGYYTQIIKCYEIIAKPLIDMLKKNRFRWQQEVKPAIQRLKKLLSCAPILTFLDSSKDFFFLKCMVQEE